MLLRTPRSRVGRGTATANYTASRRKPMRSAGQDAWIEEMGHEELLDLKIMDCRIAGEMVRASLDFVMLDVGIARRADRALPDLEFLDYRIAEMGRDEQLDLPMLDV